MRVVVEHMQKQGRSFLLLSFSSSPSTSGISINHVVFFQKLHKKARVVDRDEQAEILDSMCHFDFYCTVSCRLLVVYSEESCFGKPESRLSCQVMTKSNVISSKREKRVLRLFH